MHSPALRSADSGIATELLLDPSHGSDVGKLDLDAADDVNRKLLPVFEFQVVCRLSHVYIWQAKNLASSTEIYGTVAGKGQVKPAPLQRAVRLRG